jgi:hypothetical protein
VAEKFLIALYTLLYGIVSVLVGSSLAPLVGNYLLSMAFSFVIVGALFYLGAHYVLREASFRLDARLLHEMAKRGLIELRTTDEK